MNKALQPRATTLMLAAGYHLVQTAYRQAAEASAQSDPLLLPLLRAATAADYEDCLRRLLLEHAQPVINRCVKKKLRVSLSAGDGRCENQDALELGSEIQTRLCAALQELRRNPLRPINNFYSYVAVTAHNACHEFLRRKYPERHSLKNKLRYLMGHHARLTLWEAEGIVLCGISEWRDANKTAVAETDLRLLIESTGGSSRSKTSGGNLRALSLPELVTELFNRTCAPVELDVLVSVVSDLLWIKERRQLEDVRPEESSDEMLEALPDKSPGQALALESRLYLERLWSEIRALPARQRAALLLNLKDADGRGVIELLPLTGVATMRQIAMALEMSAEELAGLWNELPMDDATIALRLNATRQQVINLRKSARQRLARRMDARL
jgi:hypothetical protein